MGASSRSALWPGPILSCQASLNIGNLGGLTCPDDILGRYNVCYTPRREVERHYNRHRRHQGMTNARPPYSRPPEPITDPAVFTRQLCATGQPPVSEPRNAFGS